MPIVADYSTMEPVTVTPLTSLLDAAVRMRDEQVGCLVVVSEEPRGGERPIGILTDRDIVLGALAQRDRPLHLVQVGEVMTPDPVCVQQTDDISDVLVTMREKGVRRLPVVAHTGAIIGVLSFDDVLEYVADEVRDLALLVACERRRVTAAKPGPRQRPTNDVHRGESR